MKEINNSKTTMKLEKDRFKKRKNIFFCNDMTQLIGSSIFGYSKKLLSFVRQNHCCFSLHFKII